MTSKSLLRKAEAARSQAERKMAFRGGSLRVWSGEPEAQRTHREGRILQAAILKPTRSPDGLLFSEPRLPVSRVGAEHLSCNPTSLNLLSVSSLPTRSLPIN